MEVESKPRRTSTGPDVRRFFQDASRKKPKKQRTKAILLDGIVETIAQFGLDGTTIKEIVEITGVSHGTFYNHFESRDHAIRIAASSVANEIVEKIIETIALPDKDDEAVAAATYAFMADAISTPAWGKLLSATIGMLNSDIDESSKRLEMVIERGCANGVFRVPVTPLLSLQVRAIQGIAISTSDTGTEIDETLRETTEAVLRLLGRSPNEARVAVEAVVGRRTH